MTCVHTDSLYKEYRKSDVSELKEKGNEFLRNNQPDSALLYFTMAAGKYLPELPDSLKMECAISYANAANVYFFRYFDYAAAYNAILDALDIAEECHDSSLLPNINLNLGNIYLNYRDYDMMTSYYAKAFHSAVENKNDNVARLTISTLMAYAIADDKAKSISRELEVFDSLQRKGWMPNESLILQRKAIAALEDDNWRKAIEILRSASQLEDMGNATERFKIMCDNQISAILDRYGQYEEAIEVVENTALDTLTPLDMRAGSLEMLASLHASNGDAEKSLHYGTMAHQISDSLFRSQQYGMIRDISETRKIKKLDNQLLQTEIRRQQLHTAFVATLIGVIVVSGLLVVLFRQNRQLRQRNRDLFLRHRELLDIQASERVLRKEQRLDAARHKDILERIENVFENEELISSSDFSLSRLADEVESNTNYVSQVINDEYQKNFNTLLGEQRIRIACHRLCDPDFANLTIEAIAVGIGFKSRSNFITVFKKVTGLTPSQYRSISHEENKNPMTE